MSGLRTYNIFFLILSNSATYLQPQSCIYYSFETFTQYTIESDIPTFLPPFPVSWIWRFPAPYHPVPLCECKKMLSFSSSIIKINTVCIFASKQQGKVFAPPMIHYEHTSCAAGIPPAAYHTNARMLSSETQKLISLTWSGFSYVSPVMQMTAFQIFLECHKAVVLDLS